MNRSSFFRRTVVAVRMYPRKAVGGLPFGTWIGKQRDWPTSASLEADRQLILKVFKGE